MCTVRVELILILSVLLVKPAPFILHSFCVILCSVMIVQPMYTYMYVCTYSSSRYGVCLCFHSCTNMHFSIDTKVNEFCSKAFDTLAILSFMCISISVSELREHASSLFVVPW